ncbi:DUF2381 family protein [Stigmatella sp. ncwal1]|uniref:DUF2381 family protein n=1 Tax=Stigmatella ashevillensis TaxID=2995309 RepID=A0ABT5D1M6_9BACT|nr:DUF2381 family protein [Stigmatella ashevillena]MDC0707481.1 DUF2381 family protein [Stigmatella ashevillena]
MLLLVGAEAQAQPSTTREQRQRPLTVTGNPAEPPHEIRVAKGVITVLRTDTPIKRDAIEVDGRGTRITVDVGDSSIILEPLLELGSAERLVLRVPFADGHAPAQAVFVLMPSPSDVDTRIDVVRRVLPDPACQAPAAPCAAVTSADAVTSGLIDDSGVQTGAVPSFIDTASGFESQEGVFYRAWNWVLVEVEVIPPSGHPSWRPTRAMVTSKTGSAVPVRAMKAEPSQRSPGRGVRVFVEMDVPAPTAGLEFVLQLHGGADAPSLSIPTVKLPPAKEDKR